MKIAPSIISLTIMLDIVMPIAVEVFLFDASLAVKSDKTKLPTARAAPIPTLLKAGLKLTTTAHDPSRSSRSYCPKRARSS